MNIDKLLEDIDAQIAEVDHQIKINEDLISRDNSFQDEIELLLFIAVIVGGLLIGYVHSWVNWNI